MSFINWGEETPEQKATRRYFEEQQALFEQAVRMSRTTGAMAGAAGSGQTGESLPSYCGGDKAMVKYQYVGFNVLSKEFEPSFEDLDTYSTPESTATPIRAWRDAWLKAQSDNAIEVYDRKTYLTQPLPEVYPVVEPFSRLDLITEQNATWYCKNVDEYPEWADDNTDIELPGIKELNIRDAVQSTNQLSASGSPGDIIWVIDDNLWYAWDKNTSAWSNSYYNGFIRNTHLVGLAKRDAALKAKNELVLALNPFVWAAKYVPEFRIKKDNL